MLSGAAHRVRIPMHAGTDSLNVGAAAAVALHLLGPNGG
jgi:tRNA G18 (ribose-2'-O)-methylase SpoU